MMNFLRRHQKKLFIVITVMVIASFVFFGTFNTFAGREVPDRKVGEAMDGSSITEKELNALIRLLTLGSQEILQNDLMQTGLTSILAEKYFDQIKDDFQEKLDKAHRWATYTHPQIPFLSAAQIWSRDIPQLPVHLRGVKEGSLSPKTFEIYSKLYLDQIAFPPEYLRRFLIYQQQQYSWVAPDPALRDPRHVALFGYQSFEEWFGPRFTEILGKFVYNTAIIAEKRGYRVSTAEARADLLQTCLQAVQSSNTDAGEFLNDQIYMAGIDESTAINVWKKAMLVHRFMSDIGEAVLMDPLSYEQFASFADEVATVEVYRFPPALRLGDTRSLLKFHCYLDAAFPKLKSGELPRQPLTPEEIAKKAPELVVSRFNLEVAKVTQEEVGSRLTLKETWAFEVSDEGWTYLTSEYPILMKASDDRLSIFDALEPNLRLKIDQLARSYLIKQHPEWIEEALAKASAAKLALAIPSSGKVAPFDEVEDPSELLSFLEGAPLGEKNRVFQHGKTYYQIVVLEKPSSKEVMTLAEAFGEDLLGALLDRRLEGAYSDVRKKDPARFRTENNMWKPFSEVRDDVGAVVYADLLQQFSLDRLMEKAQQNIITQGEASPFLQLTGEPLLDQWKLIKETQDVKRSDLTTLSKTEMFSLAEGAWSAVTTPPNGDVAFFRFIKKGPPDAAIGDKVDEGHRLLSMDARRLLMHELLTQMEANVR